MEASQKWNPRYRAIGYTSSVDESLFGNSGVGIKTDPVNKTKRKVVTGPLSPSAAIVSASELARIKRESIIKSEADIRQEREMAERIKEEKQKQARDRKLKMKELEKRSQQLAKKSDAEIAEESRKQTIRELAAEKIDSNSDVVKLLNSMAQRAIAFTVRDEQLKEKKRLSEIEKEYDKRSDIVIEIDRITDIQRREEEENYKKNKRAEDRKVINQQIADRERRRMLEMEAREQENLAMRKMMEKYKEEDEKNARLRKIELEKSRAEVIKANEDAIRIKKEKREQEKKEIEDILMYQAMKDAELAKREEEEAIIERAKKERQAKLLAQQERAQSNQGRLDELRARRAAEERDRIERQKQKEMAKKKKKEIEELLASRAKQAADKQEKKKLEKKQVEQDLMNQITYIKRMEEREAQEAKIKQEKLDEHKRQLLKQIDDIEYKRKNAPAEDPSYNIRQELIREEEKLKTIRNKMVKDLEQQGVNPQYLSEMKSVDIGKILRR